MDTTGGSSITVWRVDEPRRPHLRLALPDGGVDQTADPEASGTGWLAFSPDGSQIYASGAGRIVKLDLKTGGVVREFAGRGGLALSPDGMALALRTADGVEIVDTSTGETRARLPDGNALAATFLSDGWRLATASADESVTLWDAVRGQVVQTFEGHSGDVVDVAYTERSGHLFSIAGDRAVFEWDPAGTPLARTIVEGSMNPAFDGFVLVSPTADSVLVRDGSLHHTFLRIDVDSGEAAELGGADESTVLNGSAQLKPIWAAYTPDGRRVVGVLPYGSTRVWAVDTGEVLASRKGRGLENLGAVAVSPDTGAVLVADVDGRVVELDGRTLSPTGRSTEVDVVPERMRASVGGTFAVTGVGDEGGTDVVFGDLDEDEVTARAHVNGFESQASFSPDGTRYAFGTHQGNIGVIDVATGSVSGPSTVVHAGTVASVAFSPDGETLATFGFDGELVLADAAARPRARSSPRGVGIAGTISYAPDGKTILIAYADGAVVAYDVDPTAWIDHACRVAGRDLSAAEWRDAFGSRERRRACSP
jgi:WD40 repeat protein